MKELKYVYISIVSTFKTEIDMNNKIILISYQFFSSENFCIISLVYLDIRYDCISIKYSRSDLGFTRKTIVDRQNLDKSYCKTYCACAYQEVQMFVFRKMWHALFLCNTRFEIRSFALLPTLSNYIIIYQAFV